MVSESDSIDDHSVRRDDRKIGKVSDERSNSEKRRDTEDTKNDRDRRRQSKRHRRDRSSRNDGNDDGESFSTSEEDHGSEERRRERIKRRKKDKKSKKSSSSRRDRCRRSKKKDKRKKRPHTSSSSESSGTNRSSDSSSEDSGSSSDEMTEGQKKVIVNKRLLAKLAARGETLEERKARRAQQRAARIQATLGYTPEDNPFNDPNLHETFTWQKREIKMRKNKITTKNDEHPGSSKNKTFEEIEKVRKRRKERELQFEEMERIRAEEARMKELENYDEWARKEEEFHLQQQKQRSAIRLVEGREKPIDVLAKNIILFGVSEQEKESRSSIKYQEKYNALEAMEDLEAELEEPHILLKMLKLNELEELLSEIGAFQKLEREASSFGMVNNIENESIVLRYWDNLRFVAEDEIKFLKAGGTNGKHATMVADIRKIFEGDQSVTDLQKMNAEIDSKLRQHSENASSFGGDFDREYWLFVKEQLAVHLAKIELSDLHSKMLVRQLEKLEKRREQLADLPADREEAGRETPGNTDDDNIKTSMKISQELGDLEEELGLTSEYELHNAQKNYTWQDKYRPRKPRYFNRVKSGYDWNKYNQTHYDKDNPPPKTVQGYKFNIFYPDLIDPTKTPQFKLEPANTDDFCIIRFMAGPPYEDIAFKIVNREWNRSRKRGFKCTFERGVLSLYFNFTTHWYRK